MSTKSNKKPQYVIICLVVLAFILISFGLAYFLKPEEWSWSNMFLNLAVSLLQLLLAIIIVNIYISKREKQNEELKINEEKLGIMDKF